MKKMYFTLTGTNHYHGQEFLKKGMALQLVKEPDNAYDKEAIKMRSKIEANEYKDYILGFIFYKFLSDKS